MGIFQDKWEEEFLSDFPYKSRVSKSEKRRKRNSFFPSGGGFSFVCLFVFNDLGVYMIAFVYLPP